MYKDNYYGIDKNGKLYVWGARYNEPTEIKTKEKISEIDGKILLGQNGLIYTAENPEEKIPYINNVYDISCGADHNLFIRLDGLGYSIGANDIGQLGNKKVIESKVPSIVKTEEGYLGDVISISAGTKTSIAGTLKRRSICMGR